MTYHLKKVFKDTFPFDLYTRQYISKPVHRTIEHVVPTRLLFLSCSVQQPHRRRRRRALQYMQNDSLNYFVVDKRVNQFRRDYRFGGSLEEIMNERAEWEGSCNNLIFRNRKKRLFFPCYGRKLVAMTCLDMIQKYNSLYRVMDQIMIEKTVVTWLDEPMDTFDQIIYNKKLILRESELL